jgi:lipopolysaccharide biosynthesis protein
MKYLVVYSYYETYYAPENLLFFLQNGVTSDPNVHYVFVISSPACSVPILPLDNVTVIHRENFGYDFGSWGAGLKAVNVEQYDRFVFLNATALGPFVPRYVPTSLSWLQLFTHRLSDSVKIVGPTLNYLPYYPELNKHIQSFAYGTDREGIRIWLDAGMFDPKVSDKKTLIATHELELSRLLLARGYDLFAFQLSENVNSKITDKTKLHDDPHFNDSYYGLAVNPLEVMFVKSNRLKNDYVAKYRAWMRGDFVSYP